MVSESGQTLMVRLVVALALCCVGAVHLRTTSALAGEQGSRTCRAARGTLTPLHSISTTRTSQPCWGGFHPHIWAGDLACPAVSSLRRCGNAAGQCGTPVTHTGMSGAQSKAMKCPFHLQALMCGQW